MVEVEANVGLQRFGLRVPSSGLHWQSSVEVGIADPPIDLAEI